MDKESGTYCILTGLAKMLLILPCVELFSPLCTVTGDTSKVPKVRRNGRNGVYYTQAFKVVLICGLTELKAQLSWMQKVRPFAQMNIYSVVMFLCVRVLKKGQYYGHPYFDFLIVISPRI